MNCPKNMSRADCELQMVRKFVDSSSRIQGTNFIKDPKILEIIRIVEQFLKDIDPSILIIAGFGAYYYLIGNP